MIILYLSTNSNGLRGGIAGYGLFFKYTRERRGDQSSRDTARSVDRSKDLNGVWFASYPLLQVTVEGVESLSRISDFPNVPERHPDIDTVLFVVLTVSNTDITIIKSYVEYNKGQFDYANLEYTKVGVGRVRII
jgi:hypothetical protein